MTTFHDDTSELIDAVIDRYLRKAQAALMRGDQRTTGGVGWENRMDEVHRGIRNAITSLQAIDESIVQEAKLGPLRKRPS